MSGKRHNKMFFGLSVILTIGVAALIFLYMVLLRTVSINRSVKLEIDSLKAEGYPVTLKDLQGKNIPDDKNAAVLYEKAFKIISTPQAEKDINNIINLLPQDKPQSPDSLAKAGQIAVKYKAVIPIIEEAVKRPECKFPIDWSKGAINAEFPHYKYLRCLSGFLCTNALIQADNGRMDDAAECLNLNYKMANSLEADSGLISALVQFALINNGTSKQYSIIKYSTLNEDQAKKIDVSLSKFDLVSNLKRAMAIERSMGIWCFEEIKEKGPDALEAMCKSSTAPPKKTSKSNYIYKLWRDTDELYYIEQMKTKIQYMDLPYIKIKTSHPDILRDSDMPRYALLSALLCPALNNILVHRDITNANIALAQTALALDIYKSHYGKYPSSLDDLKAKHYCDFPKDPFSGKYLIYKKMKKGYLIYSIGPNLKDDNGIEPAKDKRIEEIGDIVWRIEH